MKFYYYPETDSLYIELKPIPGAEAREIVTGLVVDLEENGEVVGFDIERLFHAKHPSWRGARPSFEARFARTSG
jgi:uncharacterized protein YuzE